MQITDVHLSIDDEKESDLMKYGESQIQLADIANLDG